MGERDDDIPRAQQQPLEAPSFRAKAAPRWIACALAVIGLSAGLLLPIANAEAKPRKAYAVMDADSGRILSGVRSRERAHPASLTKMMTLYLVFEAIGQGKLSLDQKVRTSRRAAGMPASKLGLKRGERVTIREAIRGSAIKSANDAAVVLAEAVAGSEPAFAKRMTAKARALGMKRTTFKNASGLTARGHLSTPRDMAILSRRLWRDFPQYYNLFARETVRVRGVRLRNTNGLLGKYRGADGIKTGYTSAAGFNLAASAIQNGRRAIVVYFGADNSRKRDRRVASLLDSAFKKMPKLKKAPRSSGLVAFAPIPTLRTDGRETTRQVAQGPSTEELKQALSTPAPAPSAKKTGTRTQSAKRGRTITAGETLASDTGAQETVLDTGWEIQVGAYFDRPAADHALRRVLKLNAPGITAENRAIATAPRGTRTIFRARFVELDETAARSACAYLSTKSYDCALVPPSGWRKN